VVGALKKIGLGALEERMSGEPASRTKSLITAAGAGFTVAGFVYKLLRSGGEGADGASGGAEAGEDSQEGRD
jgi:hypothetical protein